MKAARLLVYQCLALMLLLTIAVPTYAEIKP